MVRVYIQKNKSQQKKDSLWYVDGMIEPRIFFGKRLCAFNFPKYFLEIHNLMPISMI